MKHQPRSTTSRLRDDSGFLLIEVVVSAAILLIVSVGVFQALSDSDRLAGQQGRRAVAANVGEAELERIRSLPIEDVANLKGAARVQNETNVDFTVKATSKWVTDGADEPDCTTRSGGLDYMRVTSTVTWPKMGTEKPISLSTIITPSSRASSSTNGSLSVNVTKADGTTGVPGLEIQLVGTPTFTETTNVNGCVVFPFVPANDYVLKFSRMGWVTQDSVQAVSETVKVAAGQTTKLGYMYDLGGYTKAQFVTGQDGEDDVPSYPRSFSLANGEQKSGPIITTLPNTATAFVADRWDGAAVPLFPFTSPYSVYAGTCGGNAGTPTFVNITGGQTQSAGKVRLPSYDVQVWSGSAASPASAKGTLVGNAKIVFNAGCGVDYVNFTESSGTSPGGQPLLGRLRDPGFPYTAATGTLCVSGIGSDGANYRYVKTAVANTNYSASPPAQMIFLRQATGGTVTVTRNGLACAG